MISIYKTKATDFIKPMQFRNSTQWRNQEFCWRGGGGGVQQIQLRTEGRENGDPEAVAS
jgi:hypothetical protein